MGSNNSKVIKKLTDIMIQNFVRVSTSENKRKTAIIGLKKIFLSKNLLFILLKT